MLPIVPVAPPLVGGAATRPLVIAHRGASGYRPEHTLAGYELAVRLGADVIEPDLVATTDGHLVCRHEPEIGTTTDVAGRPAYAAHRRSVLVDDELMTGWFVHDLTLEQVRELRAVERIPALRPRNTLWDGWFGVPTFAEVLELRHRLEGELRRPIGIAPELKHPTHHLAHGVDLAQLLADELARDSALTGDRLSDKAAVGVGTGAGTGVGAGSGSGSRVIVQCFEPSTLRRLAELGVRASLCQLVSASGAPFDIVAQALASTGAIPGPKRFAAMLTPHGLADVARYAHIRVPSKSLLRPNGNGSSRPNGSSGAGVLAGQALVEAAHAAGLAVVPYTFRAENAFLDKDFQIPSASGDVSPSAFGRAIDELLLYLATGVDGIFTDHPDIGVYAVGRQASDRSVAPIHR